MQRIFGKGVQDIVVKRESLWFLPGGHTNYWDKDDDQNVLKLIVKAMKL
jgi:putative intracellular protease/amidase